MENEYKNIDRFDAYLNDTLSAEDKFVFEREMLENTSLKNEFDDYKLLVEGIKESRKQELKDYIKAHKGKHIDGSFRINSKWYAVAAVIVFFVAVYGVFNNQINPDKKEYAIESPVNKPSQPNGLLNETPIIPTPPPEVKQDKNPIVLNENSVNDAPPPLQEIPMATQEMEESEISREMLVEDIKLERLIASNSFPVLTYREYLKDQEPVANKMISKDFEESDSEKEKKILRRRFESNTNNGKTEEPKAEQFFLKTEIFDSTFYNFHYLWADSNKIKLYGVDRNAKIVFLHTLDKYAILINGNGYEITLNKTVQPLKKTNLDIYLK